MTASGCSPRDAAGVRLITRKGNDFTYRFPFIALAVGKLPVRSCLIDGEAIMCDDNGLAVFELIRRQRTSATAVHCAFDLLELDGEDLRRLPIERRKGRLAKLLRGAPSMIVANQHYEGDGAIIYKHACKLGCEGIVSKRLGSPYRSGRSAHWLKVKNPNAPPVTRKAEEDGGKPPSSPIAHYLVENRRLIGPRLSYYRGPLVLVRLIPPSLHLIHLPVLLLLRLLGRLQWRCGQCDSRAKPYRRLHGGICRDRRYDIPGLHRLAVDSESAERGDGFVQGLLFGRSAHLRFWQAIPPPHMVEIAEERRWFAAGGTFFSKVAVEERTSCALVMGSSQHFAAFNSTFSGKLLVRWKKSTRAPVGGGGHPGAPDF
jgi:hypothetical protein